ncbi:NADH oxidase (putative) [Lactobacillus plantarum WCFS1] [Lactiplantibacillus mudanjiangensis]|uniref:FAD-dependent oxidoreductase n=1 Tax=Lactiplantibacillus mudanjiangensis TaxID=1296538 RepID=UPI0010158B96|nr:NADH oxidase (putative) [Lactobacillus plantarum WCFS1] [Lactiplantibacillus mudanjiangensis]
MKNLLIIGGSDAGISCGLRIKELNPAINVTILLKDEYPNLSICGIPYAIGGEVTPWQKLAHRTLIDLQATGLKFHMNTTVTAIQPDQHTVTAIETTTQTGKTYTYDQLLVATGALPKLPPITGLTTSNDHIQILHTMADYFAIESKLTSVKKVAIIGSGYIGLEMAEALVNRGLAVTIFQRGSEVLSTFDPELGAKIHQSLTDHGVNVITTARLAQVQPVDDQVQIQYADQQIDQFDLVLVVTGVKPNSNLLSEAGAKVDDHGAVVVNDQFQTSLPDIWAAGDLVATKHRLLGSTYLPLGTTSHKQGRVAGTNLAGQAAYFQGVVGTQVVKLFNLVAARTGLTTVEAQVAGFKPFTWTSTVDDHKAYIPGARPMTIQIIGDRQTGQLLGAQLIGAYGSEVAKRNDVYATAIFNQATVAEVSDLDLSYSPPLGAPWDAIQAATQAWELALIRDGQTTNQLLSEQQY